jgi:hypothetical protein
MEKQLMKKMVAGRYQFTRHVQPVSTSNCRKDADNLQFDDISCFKTTLLPEN